jgi:hypothetical protein
MKRMQLISAALCLVMLTTVVAGVVTAKQDVKSAPTFSITPPIAQGGSLYAELHWGYVPTPVYLGGVKYTPFNFWAGGSTVAVGVGYKLIVEQTYGGSEQLQIVYDGPSYKLTDNIYRSYSDDVLIRDGAQASATLIVYDLAGNSVEASYPDIINVAGSDRSNPGSYPGSIRSNPGPYPGSIRSNPGPYPGSIRSNPGPYPDSNRNPGPYPDSDRNQGPQAGQEGPGTSAFFVASTSTFWQPVPGTECYELYRLANFNPVLPDTRSTERATAAFVFTDPQAMTGQLTILSGNNASPSPYEVSVIRIETICGGGI